MHPTRTSIFGPSAPRKSVCRVWPCIRFEMWLVASIGESKAQMFGEAGATAASQSPCIR